MTVTIVRDPAFVRTVRLVAASVVRRTAHDEDFVEEVRLAVGEACALLLGEDPSLDDEPVTVHMSVGDAFTVRVSSTGDIDVDDPPHSDVDGVQPWALLRGLVDDFSVHQDGATTTVTMSWRLAAVASSA